MQRDTIDYIFLLSSVAFGLHLIWENAQTPLYRGFLSFSQNFPVCFVGTLGDVTITLFALAFLLLFKKSNPYPLGKKDFIALAIVGFFTAVLIEQNALLLGKWQYTESMPLIPYFQVGLVPVLQMTILLPLSFFITQKIYAQVYEQDSIKQK